jgi:uncharacterized protein (DUF488 family)
MTVYELDRSPDSRAVYTAGIARIQPQELYRLISDLKIKEVFDVRSIPRQRVPKDLRPAKIASLVSKAGATYHDETVTLGDRPDFELFALTPDFTESADRIRGFAGKTNILLVCAETDYRKCHRKIIASYLSRKGLLIRHLGKDLSTIFQPTLAASTFKHPLEPIMFTIGFTRKSMREFLGIMRDAKINRVVDIRLRPVSQYSGFARKEDLEFLLELIGIEYVHRVELAPTPELLDNYRIDDDWGKYERGFVNLLRERKPDAVLQQLLAPGMNVAFLCTEDSPERCHRRLVSEYARAIFPNLRVIHLTSHGTFEAGSLETKKHRSTEEHVRNQTIETAQSANSRKETSRLS